MKVETTKGLLEHRQTRTETDRELAEADEWWLADELIHRSVHVTLKQSLGAAVGQGIFG